MPRKSGKVPAYVRHKASGQAVVRIGGRDHYLGVYGTDASHEKYERLIAQWRAMRRADVEPSAAIGRDNYGALSVDAVLVGYLEFASSYYARDGKTTQEYQEMTYALKPVRRLYGRTPARDFGPLALKSVREEMIESGLARSLINARVNRIKRAWKWAVSEELLPPGAYEALRTVAGLRKGHTTARETAPIQLVAADVVDATLPHLPPVVADMVRFQRLTGCRPGEVCILRPCDVDRASDVWEYRPHTHKTDYLRRHGGAAPGPNGKTYDDFTNREVWELLLAISRAIRSGTYRPGPDREVKIPKASGRGHRTLRLQNIEDRVVARAIVQIIQLLLDPGFDEYSYGYRPGLDRRHALATAIHLAETENRMRWVFEDAKDAFDNVPINRLLDIVRRRLPAAADLWVLIERVLENDTGRGLRQGSPLAPLMLNLYLDHFLDRVWRRLLPDTPLLRSADDLLVLCRTEEGVFPISPACS
jgi:integrase